MQLEQITAPPAQSPQMRYASLHRALEKGIDSDSTYIELVKVCVQLALNDEAVRMFHQVEDPRERLHLQNLLLRHRVITEPILDLSGGKAPRERQLTFREEITSAFQFLFHDHLPISVISLTIAFPVIVGVGGMVTQKTHSAVLSMLVMLPGVFALALVCGLARRILLDARSGRDEAPRISDVRELVHEGGYSLFDAALFTAICMGPAVVLYEVGQGLWAMLGALALGGLLLPMALVLRTIRGDWATLAPHFLFAAIAKGGMPYLRTALVAMALFAPALAAGYATLGSEPYLVFSVLGPLVVAPVCVAARLLGRMVESHADRLSSFTVDCEAPAEHRDKAIVTVAATRTPSEIRRASAAAASKAQARPASRPASAPQHTPLQKQEPKKISTPAPAPIKNPTPVERKPVTSQKPQPQQKPAQQPVVTPATRATDPNLPPDLQGIPGLRTVTGPARTSTHAASATKRR